MARALRFQYPGAIYQVMARGDGGKVVFASDDDRLVFLKRLEKACGSCGWRVHAWVLMGNLAELRKGDGRKALLAAALRRLTAVATEWVAQRLAMGHAGSVSRQVGVVKRDRKLKRQADGLEIM